MQLYTGLTIMVDPNLRPRSPSFELDHRVVSVLGSAARRKPHSRHPESRWSSRENVAVSRFAGGAGDVLLVQARLGDSREQLALWETRGTFLPPVTSSISW